MLMNKSLAYFVYNVVNGSGFVFCAAVRDVVELYRVTNHVTRTAPILFIYIHGRRHGHVTNTQRRPLYCEGISGC